MDRRRERIKAPVESPEAGATFVPHWFMMLAVCILLLSVGTCVYFLLTD